MIEAEEGGHHPGRRARPTSTMGRPINWTAIAAMGQAISSAAVVLTLVYLTNQIRQAETASTDANRLARSGGVAEFFLAAAHDPEFRLTERRIRGDTVGSMFTDELCRRFELTPEEATQLAASAQYWFWLHWGQWRSSMDEEDQAELRNMVQRFYALPQIRAVWEAHQDWMDPVFARFVNEALADAPPPLASERAAAEIDELRARLDDLAIGIPYEDGD